MRIHASVCAIAGVLAVTGVPAVAIVAGVPADPGGILRIVLYIETYLTIGLSDNSCQTVIFYVIGLSEYLISDWRIREFIGHSGQGLNLSNNLISD